MRKFLTIIFLLSVANCNTASAYTDYATYELRPGGTRQALVQVRVRTPHIHLMRVGRHLTFPPTYG